MIKVSDISVQIGQKVLLDRVSLELHSGEVVAIIGPNGAGKSTLIKAIGKELSYKSGQIYINKTLLKHWKSDQLAKTRAILSQQTQLSFPLLVEDVVLLGRFPYSRENNAQSKAIVHWSLEQVQLSAFAERNMLTLSGGEQQRVHFARTLCQLYEPDNLSSKFLFLDEPISSLDIAQQYRLLELTQYFAKKFGLGVLMVLHDMNMAAQFADRIVLLHQGKQVVQGSPNQVFQQNILKEVFGISTLIQQHPLYECPMITPFLNDKKQVYDYQKYHA